MTMKDYYEISDWYEKLWRMNKKLDHSDELRRLLNGERNEIRAKALLESLNFELTRHGRFQELIELLEVQISGDTKNSLNRIILAESYLYSMEDPKQALQKINEAIPYAVASGEFVRNAYQVKARILRKLDDYVGLSLCMQEIMKIEKVHPQLDAAKEKDFLERLPDGVLTEKLLAEYAAFMSFSKA